jgi:type I restriction enzyme M protein
MRSDDIREPIGAIWAEFWNAGIVESADIMEQMLYLLFLRGLDDLPHAGPDTPAGQGLRWSAFRHLGEQELFALFADQVFPRLYGRGAPGATYARLMKGARLMIPTAAALRRVVEMIDALPRPHGGERTCAAFDYLSAKLARLGRRAEWHTPRHIVQLMVALVAPRPADIVCTPVGGACDFLAAVGDYLMRRHPDLLDDPAGRVHYHHRMFHAHDADRTLLRIGCMNMALHGVANPDIRYTGDIAPERWSGAGTYSLLLAHSSSAGLPGMESHANGSAQTELRMVDQCLNLLKPGGRAAVIVPQHILSGRSPGHRDLRRRLVEEQCLDGVIAFPDGFSGTHTGTPKTILLFTRTDCGGPDQVWFHDIQFDGRASGARQRPPRHTRQPVARIASGPYGARSDKHLLEVMRQWQVGHGDGPAHPYRTTGFLVHKGSWAMPASGIRSQMPAYHS